MITISTRVVALFATFSCLAFGDEPAKPPLHLVDAVNTAISSNPLLKESEERINQTAAQVPYTRSFLFPNISLSMGAGGKQDASASTSKLFNGNTYSAYTSDAHLSQPLVLFGAISAVSSAKKDLQIQKLNAEISRRDLTNQVIQGFYQVVVASLNVDTLLSEQQIIQESLKTAEKRERTGRGQLLDVLQIKTQIALVEAQIITAKELVKAASVTLATLLGDPNAQSVTVMQELEIPELSLVDKNVDLNNSHLPELEQSKISVEQIDDQRRVVLGPNLPSLNLAADYMWNSYQTPEFFSRNYSSWFAGVQLVIPIFSGLSSFYQRQSFDSQKIQLEYNMENVEHQSKLFQVTSRANLEAAQASILSGEEALKLATASLNEANRLYRLENIDLLQFLAVQQAHVQAEQTLNTTKLNYISALGNYYASYGQNMNGLVELLENKNNSHVSF